jgi:isopentenyldiphosphate isomerase
MDGKEEKILEIIKDFSKKLPKFEDGRIDYSNSDTAPVITVFIKYKDRILLLKRSEKVLSYKGKWNTVAGYLDELKPIREKVIEEIKEELGIEKNNIFSIFIGESYKFKDEKISRIWIVFPVSAELKNEPEIKLDWEHTEYKWIKPKELESFDIVSNLKESLKRLIKPR